MARMLVRRPTPSMQVPPDPGGDLGGGEQGKRVEVPKTNTDPVWSLCAWPVTFSLGDQVFEVEPLPAVHWLRYMLNETGFLDLMGLIEDLVPGIDDYIFEEGIDPEEVGEVCLDLITAVAARPWWLALRLCTIAAVHWHVLGPKMVMSGGDATVLSLSAWLDLLLWHLMDNIDPEKATMFSLQLQTPPAEVQVEEEFDPFAATETDRSTFLSMA